MRGAVAHPDRGRVLVVPLEKIPDVLSEGIGGQIGDTMLTIGLGAMAGRVMGDSGAARRIAGRLLDLCGPRWVQVAMVPSAMLIGVTMFYEVAFVIIVPVAFTLVRVTRTNLLWAGLPMSIALSTMHSFLPPHPGPTSVAATSHASVGPTLFYGLFITVPAAALIALTWPRLPFVRRMNPSLPTGPVSDRVFTDEEMPGMGWSLSVALLPVVLHVNDPGFWMFKGYFNLSVIEAIKARTTCTTVLSVLGLGGVLAMESILDALNV